MLKKLLVVIWRRHFCWRLRRGPPPPPPPPPRPGRSATDLVFFDWEARRLSPASLTDHPGGSLPSGPTVNARITATGHNTIRRARTTNTALRSDARKTREERVGPPRRPGRLCRRGLAVAIPTGCATGTACAKPAEPPGRDRDRRQMATRPHVASGRRFLLGRTLARAVPSNVATNQSDVVAGKCFVPAMKRQLRQGHCDASRTPTDAMIHFRRAATNRADP